MLKIENLCKKYPSFELKNVSFELPQGYIMGFIGVNGAGKTTTLKSILNIVKPDSGTVTVLGKNIIGNEVELKQQIGFMLGEADYYSKTKVKKVASVYKRFYKEWDEKAYQDFIRRFEIDENKKIGELSTGMRVKLAMAFALSHHAKLFIFDEPTSGLDPIARDEMLDLFHEIVESGDKSILFSTHITSDLDKCADFVIFIRNGEIIANSTKDDLIAEHLLVAGKASELTDEVKSRLIGYKANAFGFTGLMLKSQAKTTDTFQTARPDLEDIMINYGKGEAK
ncbi:MAG: ABC transporter ATP-binding protein [Firmicutes bacterium]|nr:ABC transporter ATP-binding protein [Bacillota bacterium]